jgi:Cornifin (SPRR) family
MRLRTLVPGVVAGAALLVLTGCGDQNPVTPVAAPAPSSTAAAGPAGSATAEPTATQSPRPTATRAPQPTATRSPEPTATRAPAGTDGCPVQAATLQRAAHLSAGYRIKAADVRCSQGWATAGLTAPSPEQQGDGVILFKYAAASKTWKKVGEGSSLDCEDFGMPKSTGFCSTRD